MPSGEEGLSGDGINRGTLVNRGEEGEEPTDRAGGRAGDAIGRGPVLVLVPSILPVVR